MKNTALPPRPAPSRDKRCLHLAGAGPPFPAYPDSPALRVVDFQVVGELARQNDTSDDDYREYDIYLTVRQEYQSIKQVDSVYSR